MMYCSRCIDLFLWFWGFPVSASPGAVLLVVAQSIFSEGAPVLCFGLGATTGKSGKSCLCFWPTMGMGSLWYLVVEVDDHGKCMGISLQIQVDG